MTIREQIDKHTRHYNRDLKISIVMFLLGTAGVIFLLENDLFKNGDPVNSTWVSILIGIIVVLYGFGGLGIFAFAILRGLTAQCPKCSNRFRTLIKDWRFCPFCGVDFTQTLKEQPKGEPVNSPP